MYKSRTRPILTEQVRLCAVFPKENWLSSSLNQIQGWTTVRESYSRALEQGPLMSLPFSHDSTEWRPWLAVLLAAAEHRALLLQQLHVDLLVQHRLRARAVPHPHPGGNCIKIGLPGKLILGDYFQVNRTSRGLSDKIKIGLL